MLKSRRFARHPSRQDWWDRFQGTLWRPRTVLEYLLLVALLGILIALGVIVAVELHILHRLTTG